MNHADVKKNLADYLEGDLALEERALVDAHLDHCDSCSTEVEEMLQTIRLLRTLPEPELPPMIAANVMRRIRAGESQPHFLRRISRAVQSILEPTFVLPASAIAVAALVVTVSQGTLTQGNLIQEIGTGQALTGRSAGGAQSVSSSFVGVRGDGRRESDWARGSATGSQAMVSAIPSIISAQANRSSGGPGSRIDGRVRSVQSEFAPADSTRAAPRTIRLRVDGSGVARLSMSRRSPAVRPDASLNSAGMPIFSSAIPEAWAAQFARVMYGDRASLAAGTWVASDPSAARAYEGLVQSVALSRTLPRDHFLADLASEGSDPRDAWLALGFEDPAEFARYIASQNLAEQELWAARLSQRADERGILAEFLKALRESGDVTASWVARDFAAQVSARSARESSAASESSPAR